MKKSNSTIIVIIAFVIYISLSVRQLKALELNPEISRCGIIRKTTTTIGFSTLLSSVSIVPSRSLAQEKVSLLLEEEQ